MNILNKKPKSSQVFGRAFHNRVKKPIIKKSAKLVIKPAIKELAQEVAPLFKRLGNLPKAPVFDGLRILPKTPEDIEKFIYELVDKIVDGNMPFNSSSSNTNEKTSSNANKKIPTLKSLVKMQEMITLVLHKRFPKNIKSADYITKKVLDAVNGGTNININGQNSAYKIEQGKVYLPIVAKHKQGFEWKQVDSENLITQHVFLDSDMLKDMKNLPDKVSGKGRLKLKKANNSIERTLSLQEVQSLFKEIISTYKNNKILSEKEINKLLKGIVEKYNNNNNDDITEATASMSDDDSLSSDATNASSAKNPIVAFRTLGTGYVTHVPE